MPIPYDALMPPAVTIAQINELLAKRAFGPAIPLAESATKAEPRNAAAWFALARATFGLGRCATADAAMDKAMKLGAGGPDVDFLRALIDHRLGRSDHAIGRLRPLVAAGGPHAVQASFALAEVLHRSGRVDELAAFVAAGGIWLNDPRSVLARARVLKSTDPSAAMDLLEENARGSAPALERRVSGFEAVRMLDAAGLFRRAFDLATHLHATTGTGFDLEGLLADARKQVELLKGPAGWCKPVAPPVRGVAMVVGLPRSGTTLLEQMLDRHPAVGGIGEFEGVQAIGHGIMADGHWPDTPGALAATKARELQRDYLNGAASLRRPGAKISFDKTLHAWRWLPAIASVLPGAVCLRIERDPRDTATSLFLSNFHPQAFGWTGSLESIRQVVAAERELAPLALRTLGMPYEDIRYEELVEDPRGHMERVLARLGLPMDERVLAPQDNARTVLTLSHEQVRKSINRSSIGRWRNYEFAFGPEWGA
jgi:hypothetical protein